MGRKRKVGTIRARDYWSREMTVLVVIVVGVLLLVLYMFFTNPSPRH
jgi:predicted RND superfamily exporter protein